MKRVISFITSVVMMLGMLIYLPNIPVITTGAATREDINQNSVFLKQQELRSCTLCAATMLVRRVAMMRGDSDWATITEEELKWCDGMDWYGEGLSGDFTCRGIRIVHSSNLPNDYNEKVAKLKLLLSSCPEGIIAYDRYPYTSGRNSSSQPYLP